jgi:hypothetical protein
MKYRYLYLAAGIAFLIGAALEYRPPRNQYAAVINAIPGVIFLLLGLFPQKPSAQPPAGGTKP